MSTKRDDESQSDMEVGMTTAERRRRRRRGGTLRVPSDNVPRRASTAPPVVAPVPEDPALAMSIAYSFSSDASEPIPRVDLPTATREPVKPPPSPPRAPTPTPTSESSGVAKLDDVHSRRTVVTPILIDGHEDRPDFASPMAPEAMSTVIDPPTSNAVEAVDFEVNTREMSAVDLEALGLTEVGGKLTLSSSTASMPSMEISILRDASQVITPPETATNSHGDELSTKSTKMVEVRFKTGAQPPLPPTAHSTGTQPPLPKPAGQAQFPRATSSSEAERSRGAFRPLTKPPTTQPTSQPVDVDMTTLDTDSEDTSDLATRQIAAVAPPESGRHERIKTVALSDDDLEEVREVVRSMARKPDKDKEEVLSVPDIDIQMLSDRADQDSQDIEIDVDQSDAPVITVSTSATEDRWPAATAPAPAATPPPPPVESRTMTPPPDRSNSISVPPPAPEPRTRAASHPPPISNLTPASAHSTPPPPPPATAKAPPAPPKKPAPTPLPPKDTKPRGKPWFVDLFDEDYLRTLPFLTPQATQSEAEFVIDAMGLQPGAQVLDIGCGYGRHAMELAARGFHMVGLDISTPLLVRGGEESHRRGLTINFVRGDMRELDFEAQFDGAYCLFSTFGYFDDETNKKTIANIARALKPGGRVMIEILNRDYVIADLPTRIWWEGEGCVVLEEVELNYFSSRIQVNRSVVFDDGRQLEQEISVRAYSLHEVGKLMHAAGFRVLEVSGGYQTRGRFFGNQSRHIIVLAERKDTPAV